MQPFCSHCLPFGSVPGPTLTQILSMFKNKNLFSNNILSQEFEIELTALWDFIEV